MSEQVNDPFHTKYRELTVPEKSAVADIKFYAAALLGVITEADGPPREMALAKTKLEECVMWAVKGITK